MDMKIDEYNFNLTYKGIVFSPDLTKGKITTPLEIFKRTTGGGFPIIVPVQFPSEEGKKRKTKPPFPTPLSPPSQ